MRTHHSFFDLPIIQIKSICLPLTSAWSQHQRKLQWNTDVPSCPRSLKLIKGFSMNVYTSWSHSLCETYNHLFQKYKKVTVVHSSLTETWSDIIKACIRTLHTSSRDFLWSFVSETNHPIALYLSSRNRFQKLLQCMQALTCISPCTCSNVHYYVHNTCSGRGHNVVWNITVSCLVKY